MKFIDSLIGSLESKHSHVCVGLDSRYDQLPDFVKKGVSLSDAVFTFNKQIIEATSDIAVAYKINTTFYSAFGEEGLRALLQTNRFLRSQYKNIPVLADCKRNELGDGAHLMSKEIFDTYLFTCVLVTPWFGSDAIHELLKKDEHGVCVYVHDSNPSAKEIQELELRDGSKLYEGVTQQVVHRWNTNGNVFVEAGLTYPDALARVRKITGRQMPILTSGIGAQGGKAESLRGLFGIHGKRLIVNSSRGILFAGKGSKDYFSEVRKAADTLRINILKQLSV